MAAASAWILVPVSDIPVGAALLLLQETFNDGQYSHVSVLKLKDKMQYDPKPLYIWSSEPLPDPKAYAFFFHRVKHKKLGKQEPPAYCMTIGAKPLARGGMSKDELITAIVEVCKQMRTLCTLPLDQGIEVMHDQAGPNFRATSVDLALAYQAMNTATSPPQFISMKPDIVVHKPWAKVPTPLARWNVNEQ